MEERTETRDPKWTVSAAGRGERNEDSVTAPDWQVGWATWWQAFWDGRGAHDDAPRPATSWTGVASDVTD